MQQSHSPAGNKRKRTALPPSDRDISIANATARGMLGNVSRHSWMQQSPPSPRQCLQPTRSRPPWAAAAAAAAAAAVSPPAPLPSSLPTTVSAPALTTASSSSCSPRPMAAETDRPNGSNAHAHAHFLPSPASSESHRGTKSPQQPSLPPAVPTPSASSPQITTKASAQTVQPSALPPHQPARPNTVHPRTSRIQPNTPYAQSMDPSVSLTAHVPVHTAQFSSPRNPMSNLQPPVPAAQPQAPHPSHPWVTFMPGTCGPRLDNFIATHTLNHSEQERLGTLYDAVLMCDWAFMMISLISSSFLIDPPALQPFVPLLPPDALILVNKLLLHTGPRLSYDVVRFLSSFPDPLPQVQKNLGYHNFSYTVKDVGQCFRALLSNWDTMVQTCRRTGSLPVTSDMVTTLKSRSILFQRALFRSLLFTTWGADRGEYVEAAMQEFLKEQQLPKGPADAAHQYLVYRALHDRHIQSQLPTDQAVDGASRIGPRYQAFLRPSRQSQQPPLPRPPIQSVAQAAPEASLQSEQQPLLRSSSHHVAQASPQTSLQYSSHSSLHVSPQAHSPPGFSGQPMDRQALDRAAMQRRTTNPNLPRNSPLSRPLSRPRSRPQSRMFYPANNAITFQAAQPNYLVSALHQAHLRSPVLRGRSADLAFQKGPGHFFRHTNQFALAPQKLTTEPIQRIHFKLSDDQIEQLPRLEHRKDGSPASAFVDETNVTFRLKCCQLLPDQPLPQENQWALLDGFWPGQLFFSLNDHTIEPRLKLQHGKYLPADLTTCIGADNTLTVLVNRKSTDRSPFNFAVAVEVVRFSTVESIKLNARTVPSHDILTSIKSSLAGPAGDDELAIMQSTVTIHLFEPFSNAKIFDIPVRGQYCKHREALDLDVFLETRPVPPGSLVSKVDVWKCPLCNRDCRPQSLIVDGFLSQVREELAARNMLSTRSITVKSDGSWTPDQVASNASSADEVQGPPNQGDNKDSTSNRRVNIISLVD